MPQSSTNTTVTLCVPPQDSGTITMMTLSCHTYLLALHKNEHLPLKETATQSNSEKYDNSRKSYNAYSTYHSS